MRQEGDLTWCNQFWLAAQHRQSLGFASQQPFLARLDPGEFALCSRITCIGFVGQACACLSQFCRLVGEAVFDKVFTRGKALTQGMAVSFRYGLSNLCE